MLTYLLSSYRKSGDSGDLFDKGILFDATGFASGQKFGESISASNDGELIIVGAPATTAPTNNKFPVFVYKKGGSGYILEQKLENPSSVLHSRFGHKVVCGSDGQTIFVGAPQHSPTGTTNGNTSIGVVHIFKKQPDGLFIETQTLTTPDLFATGSFGHDIAVTEDMGTLVVSARGYYSRGRIFIFSLSENGDYLLSQQVTSSDIATGDLFGYSVMISPDGSVIIVGARADDDQGSSSGSAYIFNRESNGVYVESQKILPDYATTSWSFGHKVTISRNNNVIVVGAYNTSGSVAGNAYIFRRTELGSYTLTQHLNTGGTGRDEFGFSADVSDDGERVIIGASFGGETNGGIAVLYKYNGDSYEIEYIFDEKQPRNTFYGCDVCMLPNKILIGARQYVVDIPPRAAAGGVFIYE